MGRINAVEMEITKHAMHLPYVGAERCADVFGNMTAAGFSGPDPSMCDTTDDLHSNVFFRRSGPSRLTLSI